MKHSALRTRFTSMLDLTVPIMSSPMSGSTGGTLAAAISNAGGLGTFGAHHRGGPVWLREQIRVARALTDRRFGVGFIVRDTGVPAKLFDIALQERVPVFHFSFADANVPIGQAKAVGAFVLRQVQTPHAARVALDAGADVLIAQGTEAGGHTGRTRLAPLFEELRTLFSETPILVAGGISTCGRLAQMLATGADGASVGTPFLACSDNPDVDGDYQQRILDGTGDQTVYTDMFDRLNHALGGEAWPDGIAARVLKNAIVQRWHGREAEMLQQLESLLPSYRDGQSRRDADVQALYAGMGVGDVRSVRTAANICSALCTTVS